MDHNPSPLVLDDGEACIAGAQCVSQHGDLRWVVSQPSGNAAVRLMAYGLRKIFRGSMAAVTVDVDSFQRAIASAPSDAPRVLIPIHRSYFDFLAAGYLLYARPDIEIPLPHIAAAEEFGQMPLVGTLLAKCGAFFIKRGKGKEDFQLTEQINRLVEDRETFEFFIEGARSRSRQFLAPKRGLLRCLQGTGERFALFPISITYDRVPEERSFVLELCGEPKAKMTLGKLLAWYGRMRRGEISLGRMHISCAPPLELNEHSDIPALANQITAALQRYTGVSEYHLKVFCRAQPHLGLQPASLKAEIVSRGGLVLASSLPIEPLPETCVQRSFLYHWMPYFIDDALAANPRNPGLRHFAEQTCYYRGEITASSGEAQLAERLPAVLTCLFQPVVEHYRFVARYCARSKPGEPVAVSDLLAAAKQRAFECDVPLFENALQGLLRAGLLQAQEKLILVSSDADALVAYADDCAWRGFSQ